VETSNTVPSATDELISRDNYNPISTISGVEIAEQAFRPVLLQAPPSPPERLSFLSSLFPKRARIAIASTSGANPAGSSRFPVHRNNPDLANRRLMKELADLMKRPNCDFSVETVNDLLSEWYIKIYNFDPDSQVSHTSGRLPCLLTLSLHLSFSLA